MTAYNDQYVDNEAIFDYPIVNDSLIESLKY